MPKKSFISSSPALNFISQASIDAVERKPEGKTGEAPKKKTAAPKPAAAPDGYKKNPEYIETRSRRVQLLLQPSLYEAVKARAQAEGISINEAITHALQGYTEEER